MYPDELLADVIWVFKGQKYASMENFAKAVSEYNLRIRERDWEPGKVVLNNKTIKIFYEHWLEDLDVDAEATLTSSGDVFTAGELLWLINKELEGKELGDHCFFEGLYNEEKNGRAEYLIYLGS